MLNPNATIAREFWEAVERGEDPRDRLEIGGEDVSWRLWEHDFYRQQWPAFLPNVKYRWKHETTWIEGPGGRFEYPKPLKFMKHNQEYHTIQGNFSITHHCYTGNSGDKARLENGSVFATREDAQAAANAFRKAKGL